MKYLFCRESQDRWEVLHSFDGEILELLTTDDEIDEEIQTAGKYCEELRGAIAAIESKFASVVHIKPEEGNQSNPLPTPSPKKANKKLLKLEIKKSTGEPREWRQFWDSFCSNSQRRQYTGH